MSVTFDYAFAPPHTITLCRPSASEKYVVSVSESALRISWTFSSQKTNHPLCWTSYPMDIHLLMDVSVDGIAAPFFHWRRHESGAPCLKAQGETNSLSYDVTGIAAKSGVIFKIEMSNAGSSPRTCRVQMAHLNGWVISNQGWIDGIHHNLLMTMNNGRADRILSLASGADEYAMYPVGTVQTENTPPMTNEDSGVKSNSMKKVTSCFRLLPGERKTGYFFLPYKKYLEELESVEKVDLENEMAAALKEWKNLLKRGAQFDISDADLLHCYHACVADLFVMREKIGKYTGIACGTYHYRSANSGEPLETEILLDQIGYTREASQDLRMYLETQESDGCWASRKGWEHEGWGTAFNKANAVIEHYRLTKDRAFLETNYPRMYASTCFQHHCRQETQKSEKEFERGLMPRGMGDCGMMNNGDYYGVFYPPNCQSVAADFKTLEAAQILGKTEDIPFLTEVCRKAKDDLLRSIRANLVHQDGFTLIPPIAGAPVSSIFGCLYSFYPCNLVEADDPMIQETVRYIESKQISEGGLPLGTGWLKDGIWVAMALNNIGRAYLRLGKYDIARKYLYPALNHASYFVTWCEERGAEKGSTTISGDAQHLWTPLSICQYMAEAFFFENESSIHLCAGVCPQWLLESGKMGVKGLRTPYGKMDLQVTLKGGEYRLKLSSEREITKPILLHLPRTMEEFETVSIPASGTTSLDLTWSFS